ncbi:hypothetical protein VKI21_15115 [Cyanobacterium aponinum UTEX 3222]|uniref:Sll1381 protein n=3 Tax=Cyanobacterium aponinum TaxID=379064 RepID=K9Z5A6_CYAAP|nr:hypothetical protein [Cyanobacterium aponinum]WRL41362.1 hypothetical protein VKI21_15115 [Cyanobacterium aponinum UTEX 3222]AFZ53735.1 hypothetical protein Cyan10605_1628 [Cyanobacterium aponinum PCC 10605]MBD2395909.1 hypothetical protein [Cyanobacterium aponinum FACHB-4101]MTF40672.1 hypothetical protein [Cyanobacterium aponinum 0216]PHV61181.1 hypothetical protein CSQ80_17025 [Cyanobacterium aponinum IPPAS B-1201]
MVLTLENLIAMAEDQLTEYSTDARKIEKLRRKIGIALNFQEQQKLKQELLNKMPQGFWAKKIESQRQSFALPFWGIGGLGLLLGISSQQYLDFLAPAIAIPIAIKIQQYGWKLQAQKLLLKTFEDIEKRIENS